MPPRTRRLPFPEHAVTAVVVSHDGRQWLHGCLDALREQTRPPQRVVGVDTGSTDDSAALLSAALGEAAVVRLPRQTALGRALQAGLDAFGPAAPGQGAARTEWVWILHDDCAPEPEALARLLGRAVDTPSAAVVAPKQLTWDRRYLREAGVTVNSSGFRDTGLDVGEVDQGQHDAVDAVLAAGTAGLLVRRDVWDELGGLDATWRFDGDDVDFGWRVNASGGRVVVAPAAVVRHAAARSEGLRSRDGTRTPLAVAERLNGMRVVLANTSPWLVVPLLLRYVVESLLRGVGWLLVLRSPRRARDELLALALLLARPDSVVRTRRRRARRRRRAHRELRALLAPPSRRWRRTIDAVAGRSSREPDPAESGGGRHAPETGPVAEEAEALAVDDLGALRRVLSRPAVSLAVVLVAVALVADRSMLGNQIHGGRLLPAPGGAVDLWRLYLEDWHRVGLGSTTGAPPALAVLAAMSSLLLGKVWLLVDLLVLGAAPLAGLSAYAGAGAMTRRRGLRVAAAVAYALAPPLSNAVAGGRLDVVMVVLLAPVTARAVAVSLRTGEGSAVARATVLVAVTASFAPVAVAVVAVVGAGATFVARDRRAAARSLVVLVILPSLLLLPWTWQVAHTPRLLVEGLGLPEPVTAPPGWLDLLLLHAGPPAQPAPLLWAPMLVVGMLAVLAPRPSGRLAMALYVVATAAAVVIARLGYPAGAATAMATVGVVAAAVVAVEAAPAALRRQSFGWRQAGAAIVGVGVFVGIIASGVTWLARGADGPVGARTAGVLPLFAQAEAAAPSSPRVLVVDGDRRALRYALLDDPGGLRLGAADVAARPGSYRRAVRALDGAVAAAAAGRPSAVGALSTFGVSLVVVRGSDAAAVRGLAVLDGLSRVPATTAVVYRSSLPTGSAVVLAGADAERAAAGRPLESTSRPQPVAGLLPHVHARIATGVGSRLLVVAASRSGAWHATLDGRPLAPVTAYGWAQAWTLPARGGNLSVGRESGTRGRLLLLEAVLVGLALLSSLPVRRDSA